MHWIYPCSKRFELSETNWTSPKQFGPVQNSFGPMKRQGFSRYLLFLIMISVKYRNFVKVHRFWAYYYELDSFQETEREHMVILHNSTQYATFLYQAWNKLFLKMAFQRKSCRFYCNVISIKVTPFFKKYLCHKTTRQMWGHF